MDCQPKNLFRAPLKGSRHDSSAATHRGGGLERGHTFRDVDIGNEHSEVAHFIGFPRRKQRRETCRWRRAEPPATSRRGSPRAAAVPAAGTHSTSDQPPQRFVGRPRKLPIGRREQKRERERTVTTAVVSAHAIAPVEQELLQRRRMLRRRRFLVFCLMGWLSSGRTTTIPAAASIASGTSPPVHPRDASLKADNAVAFHQQRWGRGAPAEQPQFERSTVMTPGGSWRHPLRRRRFLVFSRLTSSLSSGRSTTIPSHASFAFRTVPPVHRRVAFLEADNAVASHRQRRGRVHGRRINDTCVYEKSRGTKT